MFHFDFSELNSIASFDVFLANFEAMIVDTLIENRAILMGDKALDKLLQVALRFYDKDLIEQNLAHSINRVLSGKSGHTYAYSVELETDKKTLKQSAE